MKTARYMESARCVRKKGQLNTMEPIIIVIVLALIAGLGLLFYTRINDTQQTTAVSTMNAQQDVALLSTLARMPELACSRAETSDTKCIDLGKASAFAEILITDQKIKNEYYPIFGASKVMITYVDSFDVGMPSRSVTVYDALDDESRVRPTRTYFALYNPGDERMMFATLVVERRVS